MSCVGPQCAARNFGEPIKAPGKAIRYAPIQCTNMCKDPKSDLCGKCIKRQEKEFAGKQGAFPGYFKGPIPSKLHFVGSEWNLKTAAAEAKAESGVAAASAAVATEVVKAVSNSAASVPVALKTAAKVATAAASEAKKQVKKVEVAARSEKVALNSAAAATEKLVDYRTVMAKAARNAATAGRKRVTERAKIDRLINHTRRAGEAAAVAARKRIRATEAAAKASERAQKAADKARELGYVAIASEPSSRSLSGLRSYRSPLLSASRSRSSSRSRSRRLSGYASLPSRSKSMSRSKTRRIYTMASRMAQKPSTNSSRRNRINVSLSSDPGNNSSNFSDVSRGTRLQRNIAAAAATAVNRSSNVSSNLNLPELE